MAVSKGDRYKAIQLVEKLPEESLREVIDLLCLKLLLDETIA